MTHGRLDCRMIGVQRLHEHAAALRASARSARDLGDQLKRSLRRAEVGQMQGRIGIDYADQRHIREVESLGNHLGAQEDPHFAGAKIGQRSFVAPMTLHRVGIHPETRYAGKSRPHLGFQALGGPGR